MASSLFDEVPAWAYVAFAVLVTLPAGLGVAKMVKNHRAIENCTYAATEWEQETSNGRLFRPENAKHYGKLYAVFRKACPDGSILVNEKTIPAAVKEAAQENTAK